jgi:hypothetical protein
MGVIMDEMTLWEIIEGFSNERGLYFSLLKHQEGWAASFSNARGEIIFSPTRKEALIHAITKLRLEA